MFTQKIHTSYRRYIPHIAVGFICLATVFLLSSCPYPSRRGNIPEVRVTIENPLPIVRKDVPIILKLSKLQEVEEKFSLSAFRVVSADNTQDISSQADDTDYDGERDELVFLVDLEPQQTKEVIILYAPENVSITIGYTNRARAGIYPELHGVAWESEFAAYQMPFNQQTSVGILCKETSGLSLRQMVANGQSAVFQPPDNILGCGGFALWDGKTLAPLTRDINRYARMISNGPLRAVVQLIFEDWPFRTKSVTVTSTFSIFGGHRWSENHLKIVGADSPIQIITGLPKPANIKVKTDEKEGFIYGWGAQSNLSPPDDMGLALIYPIEYFNSFRDDITIKSSVNQIPNHTVILNLDENDEVRYHILAEYNQEEGSIETEQDFVKLVKLTATEFHAPPIVKILPKSPTDK